MSARVLSMLLGLLAGTLLLQAQPVAYNHPQLVWKSLESEHTVVHIHEGLEELGQVAVTVLEDVWEPVTSLYGYEPDTRLHVIFYDTDDYSNGGAYYYNNKIIIWATSLDFDLRGQHNWLRNVLTHEFVHIIQLGAARKWSRRVPFVYLQTMGYEPEKRDDVVQGFPNTIASYPLPGTIVPAWFAEGTAQRMVPGHRYDWWDSHRDMLLRDRVLHDALFDLDEMASFDKGTVGGESVYNQGFDFVNWIAAQYGDSALATLTRALAKPWRVSMAKAMEEALGTDGHELWRRWKTDLETRYAAQLASVEGREVSGRRISGTLPRGRGSAGADEHHDKLQAPRELHGARGHACGTCAAMGGAEFELSPPDELGPTSNLYPRISPDGRWIYYLSNGDADWLGATALWRLDRDSGEAERLLANVRGAFSLTPDGRAVLFSRTSPADKDGRHLKDLYLYYIEEKLTRRLTEGGRLSQPDLAGDGRRVVCVQNGGGSTWLATLELDSLDGPAWEALSKRERKRVPKLQAHPLTTSPYGTQFFQPRFSPDGRTIAAARARKHGRDIVLVDPASGEQRQWLATAHDERYPQWTPDGEALLYSRDEGGIFDIFRRPLAGGEPERLTRVRGAAFMPASTAGGDTLVFVHYENRGFRLHELAPVAVLDSGGDLPRPGYAAAVPPATFEDLSGPAPEWGPLRNEFEKAFVIPRLVLDDGEWKPGFYLLNNDVLERFSLTGSIAAARMTNLDLYAQASWAITRSTWFAEFYGMVRDHDERFDDPAVIVGEQDGAPVFDTFGVSYRFGLTEGHAGLRRRLNDATTLELAGSVAKYKARYRIPPATTVNYDYYKGAGLRLKLDHAIDLGNRVDQFINPRHRRWWSLELRQHWDQLIREFEVTPSGLLAEVYDPATFFEAAGTWGRSWALPGLPRMAFGLEFKGHWIGDESVDDFFYAYAGGLTGLKGYSYYSLGGTRVALGHLRLGFPLIERVGWPAGPWHFKRAYLQLFAGAGDAWGGVADAFKLKREAGADLKLFLTSWSLLPTAITLSGAWGLDEFRVPQLDPGETYGKEWRWYATLLFDFDVF
jgi:hypothetical protein